MKEVMDGYRVSACVCAQMMQYAPADVLSSGAVASSMVVDLLRGDQAPPPVCGIVCLREASEVVTRDGRSDHMKGLIADTRPTGNYGIEGDPLLIADTGLSALFEGRKNHFKGYWGGQPRHSSEVGIRYDGKFWPHGAKVAHLESMRG